MRLNARMRRVLPEPRSKTWKIQPAFAGVAERGFSITEDCVVFSEGHVNRTDFPDRTGYECFANQVHLDDFILDGSPEYLVEQALALATRLNERLCGVAPDKSFRFIIALNDAGCTLRFHTVRPDEQWETEDLEKYAEEAVGVIESSDLPLRN